MVTERSAPAPSPAAAVACHARALARLTRPRADLPAACAWIEPLADVDLRLSSEPEWGQCLAALTSGEPVSHEPAANADAPRSPLPRRAVDPRTWRGPDPAHTHPPARPARQAPGHGPELPPPLARPVSKAQLAAWSRLSTATGPTPAATVHPPKAIGARDVLPTDHVPAWFHGLGARVLAALTAPHEQTAPPDSDPIRPGSAPWADPVEGPTAPASLLAAAAHPLDQAAEGQRSQRAGGRPIPAVPAPHSAAPMADWPDTTSARQANGLEDMARAGAARRPPEGDAHEPARSAADDEWPAPAPIHVGEGAPPPRHDPRSPHSPWPGLATPAPALLPLTAEVEGAELDALAEKIRRILDEQARRHGIEV